VTTVLKVQQSLSASLSIFLNLFSQFEEELTKFLVGEICEMSEVRIYKTKTFETFFDFLSVILQNV